MTQLTLHVNTSNILHLNCWSSQLHAQLKQLRSEIRPVKTLRLNGIRTHDLYDTGIFLGSSNIWYSIYSLLLYGQLRERARWTKSGDVIGYPSGQDRAILPARDYTCCIPQEKFSRKPYNKSFIDQVCSVKMAGYWPRSFFLRVYGTELRLGP